MKKFLEIYKDEWHEINSFNGFVIRYYDEWFSEMRIRLCDYKESIEFKKYEELIEIKDLLIFTKERVISTTDYIENKERASAIKDWLK